MITMYGIPNCDTIKKAKAWLKEHDVNFEFHDYRKNGLEKDQLITWCQSLGWEAVLNKRGTTWRKLDEQQKSTINEKSAIQLLLENPAMIKRPLLQNDGKYLLGFSADSYSAFCDV